MKPKIQTLKTAFVFFLATLIAFSTLTPLQAQNVRRRAPERIHEEEQGNPSELHYLPRYNRAAMGHDHAHDLGENVGTEDLVADDGADGVLAQLRANTETSRWNSAAGRAAFADQMAMELAETQTVESSSGESQQAFSVTGNQQSIIFDGQNVCTIPDVTLPGSQCCSYTINDQHNTQDVRYRQPYHVFKTGTDAQREAAARDFAASVRASMPMYLPYRSSHVYPGSGWLYDGGSFHGAIDYSRDNAQEGVDATFGVYAVAQGRVVTKLWNDLMGNVVVIEHEAPNGDRYRTTYMHLRDGFDHDLAKAKAIPPGDKYGDDGKVTRQYRYYLFSHKANPDSLYWGTNSQKIKVDVGDWVSAGQQIAWSGNTGYGGAGWGLDNNGNVTNKATANNHLHLMTTVPDPRPAYPNDWVQIDPYGVYSESYSGGCYDLLDDTAYVRLFAPFYSNFHNVPANVVSKYFSYYPGMGYALQTLSLHRNGNEVLASGSFQRNLPSQWKARFYMTGSDFQNWFDTYHDQGLRPREISVTPDGSGNPRFNVIWKKRAGEGYYTYFGLTDAQWSQKRTEHIANDGMVLEEHVVYDTNSGRRHAAIFISSPKPVTYDLHSMPFAVFNSVLQPLKLQGYKQTSINIEEIDGGRAYSGIWRKVAGSWAMEYNLTPQQYQTAFEDYQAQGYRLHRLQGYADSDRFAAIWTK
ncbi:MAG: hypothetical protein SF097_22910 [Acidobacteriota bacterium]|nr:hypothetical protein [Acidobacteriota bacterium]